MNRAILAIAVASLLAACDDTTTTTTETIIVCNECFPPGHCMHDDDWDDWWAELSEEAKDLWSEEHWMDCPPEEED